MIKIIRKSLFLILLTVLPAYANDGPQILDWDNLVPEMAPIEYPFDKLTVEQRSDLEFIITTRNMRQQRIISKVDEAFEQGVEIRYKLRRQGLSVDKLLTSYDRFENEISRRTRMANKNLDNQLVRIPGYALPLEHKDFGVKDLLLVR